MHTIIYIENTVTRDFLSGLVPLPPRERPWENQRIPNPDARAERVRRLLRRKS
jgi:hypothetical protein